MPALDRSGTSLWRRLLREAAVILALWLVYSAGRGIAAQHTGAAFDNGASVWALERLWHLPDESALQARAMHLSVLVRGANAYYAFVHFPGTLLCLAWLFLARPAHYIWVRRVLVSVTAVSLAGHFLYPLAPPRMMTGYGFVDTGVLFGQSVYGAPGADSVANQYAAMPSLHVGWSVLVAVAVLTTTRSRWRWLVLAHPLLTVFVVVVTANHYWLDGAVSVCLLAVTLLLVPQPASSPWRRTGRVPVPRSEQAHPGVEPARLPVPSSPPDSDAAEVVPASAGGSRPEHRRGSASVQRSAGFGPVP